MSPLELTASITALANALADRLPDAELSLLSVICTQFADTLATIYTQREYLSGVSPSRGDLD